MSAGSVLMGIGDVVGGINADRAGIQAQKAYNSNANLTVTQGNYDALNSMRESRMQDGAMIAAAGAGGGNAMDGTLADVVYANAVQRQFNAMNINYGAQQKAQGLRFQGQEARAQGRAALYGGILRAGASALGGSTGSGTTAAGSLGAQPMGTIPVPSSVSVMSGYAGSPYAIGG